MYDAFGHGESIYNIIPPKEILMERPPMYRSKHSAQLPPTGSTFGNAQTTHPIATNIGGDAEIKIVPDKKGRTMGKVPGALRNIPTDYMKKNALTTKVQTLSDVKKNAPHLLQPSELKPKLKPDVPKTLDTP